jgi:Ser/Thr protein kinase RdoA (MazF antagonist)
MGSATWFIDHGDCRWVAKAVTPDAGAQFAGGLELARYLDRAGIPAGAPASAADGQLAVNVGEGWLAVLTWVPGHPLSAGSVAEREVIGTTLARVHRALAGHDTDRAQRFHWVDPDADYLSLRPWLRPAVTAALDALDAASPPSMTWGLLHADPAPGAFRLDPATGRCGVIDWSYALNGPLLYDLASAVMYVGGPGCAKTLVGAYLGDGMLGAAEVERGLAPMLRFRWAVQANYFAWRIAGNNLTGISGPQDNEKGLQDARCFLTS